MSKKRSLSIKAQLLFMSVIPVLLIGIFVTVVSVIKIRSGMLDEAMDGLLASAKLFKEEILTTGRDLTTCELEDEYKAVTGYDFTRFEGDTRASTSVVKQDGTRPIGTQASPEVIEEVLHKGHEFVDDNTEVAGMKYCVAYAPITDESGAVVGMAFAGKPTADIESEIMKSIVMIVSIAGIIVLLSIIVVYIIANNLVKAVKVVDDSLKSLSDGSFVKIDKYLDRGDEIGDMIRESNTLIDKLLEIVGHIKAAASDIGTQSEHLSNTAVQMKDTSENVSQAVEEMARGATEQADNIQVASENIGNLSDAIQSVAENAENLAGTASGMNDASSSSVESLGRLSDNMMTMNTAMIEISNSIEDTNKAVADIGEKVDGITNISSQTNLLALNASIEAARAGEAGRGFAVVAEEIGKLASDSASMADAIRVVMKKLESTSENAINKSAEVQEISKSVTDVLNSTVNTINGLISGVTTTVDGVDNISGLTEECAANKSIIVDSMSSLSAISEQNAASTEETSASMEELNVTVSELADAAESLNDISKQLTEDLKFFK